MAFVTASWWLALSGLMGSLLLLLVALACLSMRRHRERISAAGPAERRLAWAVLLAAVLGSATLFVVPAYSGTECGQSVGPATASAGEMNCVERRSSFVAVNGPQVIPLFTIPLLFAVLPLLLLRWRFRGPVFAVCAFLLAGQAAVGMSGYGLVFAPASLLLVGAGFIGIVRRSA